MSYASPRVEALQHTTQIGVLSAQLHSHLYFLCSHPLALPAPDDTRRLCDMARTLHRHSQALCVAAVELLDETCLAGR